MPRLTKTAQALIDAAREMSDAMDHLRFADPVAHVYNPLAYARELHEQYLTRFGRSRKRVVFLGMNPGPWGMAQTGVPFGEVAIVRDWMKLSGPAPGSSNVDHGTGSGGVGKPADEHPKRPVTGLDCPRSEVSGRRFWGLMRERFKTPENFANTSGGGGGHFVTNYCPLVFLEAGGKNRTPDKLPAAEREPLGAACDAHLRRVIEILKPEIVVGIGKFAEAKAAAVIDDPQIKITTVLHPSPASPLANRGWAPQAAAQLVAAGVWE